MIFLDFAGLVENDSRGLIFIRVFGFLSFSSGSGLFLVRMRGLLCVKLCSGCEIRVPAE